MSSNCYYTTCKWDCCNQNRDCPEDYDTRYWTSYYTSCYYYYNNKTTTSSAGGAIAGYVIGGIIFVVIIAVIIWQCNKRKAFEAQRLAEAGNGGGGQSIIVQNPPGYGQPTTYGQPAYGQQNYGQQPNMYGQPPVPPIYSQPYVQPAPYGGGYPQQQGPIIIQS